jgi:hypothetical protein
MPKQHFYQIWATGYDPEDVGELTPCAASNCKCYNPVAIAENPARRVLDLAYTRSQMQALALAGNDVFSIDIEEFGPQGFAVDTSKNSRRRVRDCARETRKLIQALRVQYPNMRFNAYAPLSRRMDLALAGGAAWQKHIDNHRLFCSIIADVVDWGGTDFYTFQFQNTWTQANWDTAVGAKMGALDNLFPNKPYHLVWMLPQYHPGAGANMAFLPPTVWERQCVAAANHPKLQALFWGLYLEPPAALVFTPIPWATYAATGLHAIFRTAFGV